MSDLNNNMDGNKSLGSPPLQLFEPSTCEHVPCCGPREIAEVVHPDPATESWTDGTVDTATGPIHRVMSSLSFRDRFSTWKVRWGIGRMSYTVKPGLYAVGDPNRESDIFVSANYKMSFDRLRKNLAGLNAWILVLDTKGVNVWCAAGKGTFGTDELVSRVAVTRLKDVVATRRLVVPQLGAPGVSSFEVQHKTGFKVKFGPVRAEDIPDWLIAGKVATPEMRRVRFPARERIILTPVEIVGGLKWLGIGMLTLFLMSGLDSGGYSFQLLVNNGLISALLVAIAFLTGSLLGPLLLPWLPGRSFSAKGGWIGLFVATPIVIWLRDFSLGSESLFGTLAWLLLIPAIASFILMNFTGSSTYTSFSGVKKELHFAVRFQAVAAVLGLALWITGRFV